MVAKKSNLKLQTKDDVMDEDIVDSEITEDAAIKVLQNKRLELARPCQLLEEMYHLLL